MEKKEKLPEREFKIKIGDYENGSLEAISIVEDPAIESTFQLFNNVIPQIFEITDSDKMRVTGPVMIPNKKMLRIDKKTKEYYMGWFSEETIQDCAKYYMKNGNNRFGNLNHENNYSKDFYVFESWIVEDPETDKSKYLGFKDVVKGTWFITYQVVNDEIWKELKSGKFTGFSVEGNFGVYSKVELEKIVYDIVYDDKLTDQEKEIQIKSLLNI